MSTQTYVKVSGAVSSAVATNGTITLTAPAGYSSATTITGSGAKLWSKGLMTMLTQGTGDGTFSVSYSTDITITYLGSTSIPAGTSFDFYIPTIGALNALTDNSGGTASNTLAVVTGPTFAWNGSTDPTAAEGTAINAAFTSIKNSIASLAAKIALVQTALANQQINNV